MQNQQLSRFLSAPRVLGAVLLSILLLTQRVQYASAAGIGGVPVLRTFEDLPAGKAVFNDYVGVTFPQGGADFHPITIFKPSVATASPSQALQAQLRTAECHGTQLIMSFDVPQSLVSLSTGLAPQFAGTMLLQGFSSDPTVSNAGLVAQSVAPCLGTGPTPILTPLVINDQSARILYAQLSLVSCSAPTDPTSGPSNGTIVLDNLLYNRPLHPPAREHNPPIITITSPTNGSTVQGTTPGSISTVLLATVKETAIMSMTAQINGHTAVPMNYWNTSPGNFDAGLTLDNSVGLIEGINNIVLTAVDFDRPPNTSGITAPPLGTPDSVPVQVANQGTAGLGKTWDFLLPADWTQSNLVVHVDINSGNYSNLPHGTPVPECTSNAAGTCNHNNEVELHLHFIVTQGIIVHPVYLNVQGTYKGVSYDVKPGPTQVKQVDTIFQMLNELYPFQVEEGRSYVRTVSPGISADDLTEFIANNFDSKYSNEYLLGIFPDDQGKGSFAANKGGVTGEGRTLSFRNGVVIAGGQAAWSNADDPITAAHELAHNIGFDHWGCGHDPGYDDDECGVFPIPHGGTGVVGTDIINWNVIPPGDTSNPNYTSHAHDFMTAVEHNPRWVSWYTYEILVNFHTAGSFDADDPPAPLVSGSISANGVATLRPIYQIDVSHPITDTIVEDDPNSIYTMQGYDNKGNVLFVHNFEPFKDDTHTPDYGKVFVFDEAVPFVPDLQRIEVLKGTQVLGTLMNPAPGQVPTVSITDPTSSTVWPVGKLQTIRWTSSSPAGVPLYTMVEYSPDGGKTIFPLDRNLIGSSLTINPDELPGSMNTMIYVQVSDGMNTATAAAGPFTVQPKLPSVHIITPTTNSQVTAYVPLTLMSTAYDRQESLTNARFQWSSDRDGVLGTGQQLTVSKLSAGHHTLTLTVTDSQGRIQDHVQIDVVPLEGSQSPPAFDWLIFWAIAIALLLLVLVLVVIIVRRRQTAGGQR